MEESLPKLALHLLLASEPRSLQPMDLRRECKSRATRRALDRRTVSSPWYSPGPWFDRVAKRLTGPEFRNAQSVCRGWLLATHSNFRLLGPTWFPTPTMVKLQTRAASNLDTIYLASCGSLTDECLSPLADLLQLKSLTLRGGYILTDKILINLKGLDYLTHIDFSGALKLQTAPLEGCKSLIALNMSCCPSLVSLSFQADHPLRILELQGCPKINDGGLVSLQQLKCLHHLNLSGSSVTDSCLAILQAGKLQVLTICCCPGISNAGLTFISEMHSLRWLDLSGVAISNFGLAKLAELPALQKLFLLYCPRVTQSGLLWMLQNSQSPVMRASVASITAPP